MYKVRLVGCVLLAVSIALPRHSKAQYVQNQAFNFQAIDQSMWGGSTTSYGWDLPLLLPVDAEASIGGAFGDCLAVCLNGQVSGDIGLDIGGSVNTGTVSVTMPGQATVGVDQLTNHAPGSTFTIQTGYGIAPSASMHTQGPSVSAFANVVIDATASASGTSCILTYVLGCAVSGPSWGPENLFDVHASPTLLSFNQNNNGQLDILGLNVPLAGSVNIGGVPVSWQASVPNVTTDGSAAATTLTSSGDAPFLGFGVDVPALIANLIYPGAGYLFSGTVEGLSYTTLSTSLGPEFLLGQDFTFTSTPMVTLTFSEPVSRVFKVPPPAPIAPRTSWDVALGHDFDFEFPTDAATLDVTPTYWLSNDLHVNTNLEGALNLHVDLLSVDGLGPVYSNDFTSPALGWTMDSRDVSLAFNTYQGSAFQLTATPEPSTWILLGSGLLLLGLVGSYKQPWV